MGDGDCILYMIFIIGRFIFGRDLGKISFNTGGLESHTQSVMGMLAARFWGFVRIDLVASQEGRRLGVTSYPRPAHPLITSAPATNGSSIAYPARFKPLRGLHSEGHVHQTDARAAQVHVRARELHLGVEGYDGKLQDMAAAHVWDPMSVRLQCVKTAVENATLLLRIDDVLSGTSPNQGGAGGAQQQQMDTAGMDVSGLNTL